MMSKLPNQQAAVCYRWECLSCEFFRKNVMGGLVVDGTRQKDWWCKLIDERREPCKIKDQIGAQISPPPKRTLTQTQQPRRASDQVGQPMVQQQPPKTNVPSVQKPDTPNIARPKPEMPNLPHIETNESRKRATERE
jgi:hypothetical protein